MIFKKMNIGNRNTYDVLLIDSISDTVYGNIVLLKNNMDHDPEPYVVAIGYVLDTGTWSSGWYFSDLKNAKKAFFRHTLGL